MRLYHQLYRRKNPPTKRNLSGARKQVYGDLMALMRVRNPEGSHRGRSGARILRGEAITPGIVTAADPKATKSIEQKWKTALARLERMERRETEREAEEEVEAGARAWMERRRARGQDPKRLKILRDAAKREVEIRSTERKRVGKAPLDAQQRRELIEDITQGVAAKWNLLGELNRKIAEGQKDFIPLRNVIAAEIERRLQGEALDYSVREALAELTAAEVKWVQHFLKDLRSTRGPAIRGEGFESRESPTVKRVLRERVSQVPEVRKARARLKKAEAYERESAEIARKEKERRRSTSPWQKSQILLESEALARKEAEEFSSKDPVFVVERQRAKPMDIELWDRISKAMAKRAAEVFFKANSDDAKRAREISRALKRYEKTLKRYSGLKTLKIPPYIPARFFLKSKDSIAAANRKEDGRIAALKDDDIAAKQLKSFRERVRANTGSYPRVQTIEQYREYIARRLYNMVKERWRNTLMLKYEESGGKYLTPAQERARERAIRRELGAAFPMGGGLMGIVTKDGSQYRWKVFGADGSSLMWGKSKSHSGASEKINVAHRVVLNLLKEAQTGEPGFDYLPEADRRWLSANLPGAAVEIKRILLATAGEKRELDVNTMRWLVKKEVIGEAMPVKHEEFKAAKSCKGMKVGDKRAISVRGGKVFVEAARGGVYKTFVLGKEGDKSATYRFKDCDTVMARGAMIAGAMGAGKKVVEAMGNPAALKRLENSAGRYFRKKNPSLKRSPADIGAIEDLSGMIGLPDDPGEAYRLGYYAGIIKGIDTCGVQNYMRRRRLRKDFQQKLLDAAVAHQETLTEPSGRGRRGESTTFFSR